MPGGVGAWAFRGRCVTYTDSVHSLEAGGKGGSWEGKRGEGRGVRVGGGGWERLVGLGCQGWPGGGKTGWLLLGRGCGRRDDG